MELYKLANKVIYGITSTGNRQAIKVTSDGKVVISSGSGVYPEVANYSALPAVALHTGEIYVCLAGEGVYLVNRKSAGMYYSDGATWARLGNIPAYFSDANFEVYNNADDSKKLKFDVSGVTTATTRTITMPDQDITLADGSDVEVNQQMLSTGFRGTPPVLSINGGDNTKFDMTSGTLEHIDNSVFPPIVSIVAIPSVTAGTPTFLASDTASFITIKSDGTIQQRVARSTATQRRDFATVGLISHIDNIIIDDSVNTPQLSISLMNNIQDVIRALGFFSTIGNQVSGVVSTLSLQKATGAGFALNENANIDQKDPHNFTMPALNPMTMVEILQDATVVSISAFLDPTTYDLSGVSTTVPSNNNATISYLYAFPNNSMVLLKGQEVYSTFADAKDSAGSETVVIPSDLSDGGLLLARIIMQKSATDTTDIGEVFILPSTQVSGGGASLTSLQQAYDISVEPEILTDATRGAVSLKRGSALDTDDVFEVQNGAGAQTASINGDGGLTASGLVVDHTSTESDDFSVEIITNASGFGDSKSIDIDYITGAIGTGIDEEAVLINIDETLSTGGRVVGLEVVATDEGVAEVDALEVGATVHPIIQSSGVFGDLDSILVLAVDQLTALSSGGVGNITTFINDNDTVTLGGTAKFSEVEIILDTGASGSGIAPTFEYSTGVGTWATFSPADGTNGFRNTGVIIWLTTDIPSWLVGTGSEFLIRITRTRNSLATTPIIDLVQMAVTDTYSWDKNGDLIIKGLDTSGTSDFNDNPTGFTEHSTAVSGTTITVDWSTSSVKQAFDLEGASGDITALNFTNPPNPCNLVLKITQATTTPRTMTGYDADILWPGGTDPVITPTADGVDILTFYFDGTNYYGGFLLDMK